MCPHGGSRRGRTGCRAGHLCHRLRRPAQAVPATAPPTPTTASAPTASSPSASTGNSTTSAWAASTPGPRSSCSSRTSASTPSTPLPANPARAHHQTRPRLPAHRTSARPAPGTLRPLRRAKQDPRTIEKGSGYRGSVSSSQRPPPLLPYSNRSRSATTRRRNPTRRMIMPCGVPEYLR